MPGASGLISVTPTISTQSNRRSRLKTAFPPFPAPMISIFTIRLVYPKNLLCQLCFIRVNRPKIGPGPIRSGAFRRGSGRRSSGELLCEPTLRVGSRDAGSDFFLNQMERSDKNIVERQNTERPFQRGEGDRSGGEDQQGQRGAQKELEVDPRIDQGQKAEEEGGGRIDQDPERGAPEGGKAQ